MSLMSDYYAARESNPSLDYASFARSQQPALAAANQAKNEAYTSALNSLTPQQLQQVNSARDTAINNIPAPQLHYDSRDQLVDTGSGPLMPFGLVNQQNAADKVRNEYVYQVMALAAQNQAAQPAIPAPNPQPAPNPYLPPSPSPQPAPSVPAPTAPIQQPPSPAPAPYQPSPGQIIGGGVVDDGSSFNTGAAGGLGNSGVVYGPDGKVYSSAAAAIAAGVTNFSYVKPSSGSTGLIKGADNLTNIPNAATGNANPGGLIANQNQQLFTRPTTVQLPPGVYNPFAV